MSAEAANVDKDTSRMPNRRTFLNSVLRAVAGAALAPQFRAPAQELIPLELQVAELQPVRLAPNFVGLGYEMSSVATPGLLSASNERYVKMVRALGVEGVIRAGGIVADYTRYSDSGAAKAEPKDTVITRQSLEQFNGFLVATGWQAIWSLNFAQGSVEEAILEAQVVAAMLGPRLLAFELGNEVENYARGEKPFRTVPYSYHRYRAEYSGWRSRILQTVPGASFAAPDTAASVEWVESMARDAKDDVQLLTTHYYRGGQKDGTADQLQHPDPRLKAIAQRLHAASASSGIPWRMCETNSFFGGGRPGVSDTFVGALWTLDFMLFLAGDGCAGVNLETGVNQLGFISSYSPIAEDDNGRPRAGAPYYGMLAFATAVRGCDQIATLRAADLAPNLSAYLLRKHGKSRSAVLVNRGERDLSVSVKSLDLHRAIAMRLAAPNPGSVNGVTFAGSEVGVDGSWTPRNVGSVDGRRLSVPRMSAVVLSASE